ncbi:MAG TPA: efflux RND transporter permease subunit, partial [Gemmatimonadaceae bacterium]|nr:efflux RND transporter permease subunit [Gemmatimonadaceae bacterium]
MSKRSLFAVLSEQRRVIYMATAVLSGAGIWAAFQLPSAIYPELTFTRVTIVVEGSSLDARQVLFTVTRPIEEAIAIVPGVTRVQSRSIRAGSETNVTFAPKTDMTVALSRVQARVNQIRGTLPPDVDVEIEQLAPSLFPIISYNVEGGDPATLYDLARYQIKPLISRVPGVGRVDVMGSDVREIEVVADPARLAAQQMTFADLAAAIQGATTVDAVGRLPEDYRQYLIVTTTEAHSADDVANIVVSHGLRVGDLAAVRAGTEDHTRIIAGDGRPAALINITRQIGGNTLQIADSVAAIAAGLEQTLPPGVTITPVYDQASLVRDAVKSVRDAMIIGAILAVIVLLLFLRHTRITAISASSIPITMAITVFVMSRVGQTFNLMTLGAMAIAIGLVIDDAVVITENIVRHSKLTHDRERGIHEAVQELIWPVTTSTITTVVVFLPLGLLTGVEGQFFHALSITLTIAVLVSLLVALTIIPLLSERFLEVDPTGAAGEAATTSRNPLAMVGRGIDSLAGRYERALGGAL